MSKAVYLPDVNVLVALADSTHLNHKTVRVWHERNGSARFLLCPTTESGLVRLLANPSIGGYSMNVAMHLLQAILDLPHSVHLSESPSWPELVAPLAKHIQGYRQVTDALLLGLAIHNKATLVTLDRTIAALAGKEHVANLLVL